MGLKFIKKEKWISFVNPALLTTAYVLYLASAYRNSLPKSSVEIWYRMELTPKNFFQMNHVFNVTKFFLREGENLKMTDGLWQFWCESLLSSTTDEADRVHLQRHSSNLALRVASLLSRGRGSMGTPSRYLTVSSHSLTS